MALDQQVANIFGRADIRDLQRIPQSGSILLPPDEACIEQFQTDSTRNFQHYLKDFYGPWIGEHEKITTQKILANFTTTQPKYGENFTIHPAEWYKNLQHKAQIHQLWAIDKLAMVVNNCNLRTMPTRQPAYFDPRIAGEGYPFDTLQENLLHIGEPVVISHYTEDLEFALVVTNAKNFGFVETKHLGLATEKDVKQLITTEHVIIAVDQLKIYYDDCYCATLALGTCLPLVEQQNIIIPTRKLDGWLKFVHVIMEPDEFIAQPLIFNQENVAKFIDMTIAKPYGWGGYLNNRDCAQILKDYFALFAIHIPIFSAQQIKTGHYISLESLTNEQKILQIEVQGIPFRTLLYRKGHITLYLGSCNNSQVMYHQLWGVYLYDEAGNEYRHIIGKAIISTLEYGKELEFYHPSKSSFLSRITAMTIL